MSIASTPSGRSASITALMTAGGARHGVVHEAAGDELPAAAVVDLVLHQRLADALHHPAHLLAPNDHRIDDAAEVVDDVVAVDVDRAGVRIDLELDHMGAVRMARRRRIEAAGGIEANAEFAGDRPHRRVSG